MPKKEVPDFVKKIREQSDSIDDAVKVILAKNGVTKPPINVVKIAASMGIKVFSVEFTDPNVKGAIADFKSPMPQFNGEQRIIAVDKKSYATRKIFTIAHEIGHFVMHCGESNDFFERDVYDSDEDMVDEDVRNKIERDADKFAACLLLPKDMFINFVENSPYYIIRDKQNLVQEICKKFIVAEKAAKKRLKEVGMDF